MKILFICSESSPGMRDYAIPIIRAAQNFAEVFALFVDNHPISYSEFFDTSDGHFVCFRQPRNVIKRIFFRIYAKRIFDSIDEICRKNQIDIVWSLTGESMLSPVIKKLAIKYQFIYNVHDFLPHDTVYKSFIEKIKFEYLFIKREANIRSVVKNLVSNSKSQVEMMKRFYPNKNVMYHSFPALIHDDLGYKEVDELKGISDYILFFGRVEKYKGLEYLYNAFVNSKRLQKYKLVIAGSGYIYFDRDLSKEKQVIFINRFIEDDEISFLYKNASAIVYPYVSATQSGVVSIAYHYNKPLLLSDVPFFLDSAVDGKTALFFENKNEVMLEEKLFELMENTDKISMEKEQTVLYDKMYSSVSLSRQLENILNDILPETASRIDG